MIAVADLSLRQGNFALDGISFTIPAGAYGVLMGRTGCGKTSILEAVCGLRPVQSGTIRLGDREVARLRPAERGVGYVPQDLALFSTMTVAEHMGFALEIRKVPRAAVQARIAEVAGLLGIGHLLARTIHGLSGGERQRVALGRALSFRPVALLLDEPLSALDEDTHAEICTLLKQLQRATGVTVLHITHSRREADALADVRLLLANGRVEPANNPVVL